MLDLCEDSQVVGQTCLILCDQLSEQLNSPDCEKDRLLFVNIIQQLLLYGKYRLENCTEDTFTSIQDCETYLSRVDLLQKLLFSGIDLKYQRISLSTFTDTQKSQQIRDKLIEYDRIELAIEVATKCNVDAVPAWVNWGLTLLKIGKYNEAKEKFRYCMTPTVKEENTEAKISSPRNPLPSNHSILHKIITVLESGAPSKQRELITKYNELKNRIKKPQTARTDPSSPKSAFSFSPSPKQNLIKQHSLDTSRYMQCMYYLQCYGTPDDLVKFWLRHNLIEDALRYILNAQLDVTVFQTVITAVLKTNQLQKFKEILLKIDPTQKKWNNFLLSTCKYFNNSKKYDLLLNFQEFMKDYARAGFTCIKLFAKAEDHQTQIRFLDEAKAYFVKASELEQPVNSPNDINKYMRGVNLQKEVSLFLMGQKNVKPLDITLFGAKDQKTRIAEIVLEMSNFDLAWKIMQEYQLEFTQIYKTAFKALALKKQTQAITNIMKGIRGMMMMEDEDWDELLLIVIGVYMNEGNDKNVAENFVNQLRKPTSKITGLILCKKLNKAYLEAVSTLEKTKSSDLTIIHTISSEARKTGNPHVADLCEQYISSHSN
uniref:ZFYVE26-like TPR repeats domain-containing protein n=1 Tax=Arcella intermedia TaxID=1963864 RepID=A0A6B2L006_9EUKA